MRPAHAFEGAPPPRFSSIMARRGAVWLLIIVVAHNWRSISVPDPGQSRHGGRWRLGKPIPTRIRAISNSGTGGWKANVERGCLRVNERHRARIALIFCNVSGQSESTKQSG